MNNTLPTLACRYLPNLKFRIIFDVGANKGQSALSYAKIFPDAEIFSFEPVKSTFEMLRENVKSNLRIHIYQFGLGKENVKAKITNKPGSSGNHIVEGNTTYPTECIDLLTGDDFCRKEKINKIDFLKIDTEGLDLQVLFGFKKMLRYQDISLLQVECGMNVFNHKHIALEFFKKFLTPFDYYLFHLHEFALDTKFSGLPLLRRVNAVFISMKVAQKNIDLAKLI